MATLPKSKRKSLAISKHLAQLVNTDVVEDGPDYIYARFKVGVLDLDDVAQTVRADVSCFFYFTPTNPINVNPKKDVRFVNIRNPQWTPHFDFANEHDESITTDEIYWLDLKTGLLFGKINIIISIQERFDHKQFPFDRQIIDVQVLVSNAQVAGWEDKVTEFPIELLMGDREWLVQSELHSLADAWNLKYCKTKTHTDPSNATSIVHFQIFLERQAAYYFWNIVMVYAIIISLKAVVIAFPYTESRFEFSITLALTTVAYMFVTTTMVPRQSYLTFLDIYMLSGLFLLFLRFLLDLGIQFGMESKLPFGNENERISCDESHILPEIGLTPCQVDLIGTLFLAAMWLTYSLLFAICTFCMPRLVRPDWKTLVGNQARHQRKTVTGLKTWDTETGPIRRDDLIDVVDYDEDAA